MVRGDGVRDADRWGASVEVPAFWQGLDIGGDGGAVLVGEALVKDGDPTAAVAAMTGVGA